MRKSTDRPTLRAACRWVVLVALGVAATAMVALHLAQPELNPVAQPISFYVWGGNGWLLPTALAAFSLALITLARARASAGYSGPSWFTTLAGATLLLAAVVPSDRWFPWEHPPTLSGLVHASASIFAPPLLLWPMVSWTPPRRARLRRILISAYCTTLITSAASLVLGLSRDASPPAIGLLERALALFAVVWVALVFRETPSEEQAPRTAADKP